MELSFWCLGKRSLLLSALSLGSIGALCLTASPASALSASAASVTPSAEVAQYESADARQTRQAQGIFDLAQVAQDYELAYVTAQKQGVAGEQLFWFHDQERQSALSQKIAAITKNFSGSLGVSVISPSGLVLLATDTDFPLMSVLKMPLVYVVALEMQRRGDDLDSLVPCGRSCLNADTYSPMFEQLVSNGFSNVDGIPVRNADGTRLCFPLRLLISYAVGKSDNNACDLLISNYLGGPKNVERALRELGLERTNVAKCRACVA